MKTGERQLLDAALSFMAACNEFEFEPNGTAAVALEWSELWQAVEDYGGMLCVSAAEHLAARGAEDSADECALLEAISILFHAAAPVQECPVVQGHINGVHVCTSSCTCGQHIGQQCSCVPVKAVLQ